MQIQGYRPVMAEDLWDVIKGEIREQIRQEPVLAEYLNRRVLRHDSLAGSLTDVLSNKLACADLPAFSLKRLFDEALASDPGIMACVEKALLAIRQRDPAVQYFSTALLYFKGFQSLQAHRIAHSLWTQGRKPLALFLQSQVSEIFTVDIHPAARI